MFNFLRNCQTVPKLLQQAIPTTNRWGAPFLHILVIVCPFDCSLSSGHEVAMVSIFISSTSNDVEHLMCLLAYLYIFFGEMSTEIFVHFLTRYFVLLIGYESCFLIYSEHKSFSAIWFANIFFQSVDCLFTFIMTSFEVQYFKFKVQYIISSWIMLLVFYLWTLCLTKSL